MKRIEILAAVVAAAVIGLVLFVQGQAQAHQPYGGCTEAWQAPTSAGAQHCRSHGWVISTRVVVNPSHVIKVNRLSRCDFSDTTSLMPVNAPCQVTFHDTTEVVGWIGPKGRLHKAWAHGPHAPTDLLPGQRVSTR